MPRRNLGSIRYRPKQNLFEVRVTVGYHEGKQVTKSRYVPGPDTPERRKEAERVLARMMLEHGLASPDTARPPALAAWIEDYIGSRSELRDNSISRMEGHLKHIKPVLGHLPLTEVTVQRLEAFYRHLVAPKPKGKGLAKATLTKIHQLIGAALRRAVRYGYIPANPADLVELPRLSEVEAGRALPAEHQARLLEAARNHRLYALLYLTLALGLRRGEALGLRWEDLETWEGGGLLRVRRAYVPRHRKGEKPQVGPTKTSGSDRTLPLNAEIVAVLERHREQMQAEGQDVLGGWMFPSAEGTPLDPRNFNRLYESWQVKAGLYEVVETTDREGKLRKKKVGVYRLHDLRVTSETEMIRATGNPKLAATFHGQRSVTTAVRFYNKVALADLEAAIQARRLPQAPEPEEGTAETVG